MSYNKPASSILSGAARSEAEDFAKKYPGAQGNYEEAKKATYKAFGMGGNSN